MSEEQSRRRAASDDSAVSTADRVGDGVTSEAKRCFHSRLTVCKHGHVSTAPERRVSSQRRGSDRQAAG